jgi:phosphohistidine phosphatase
MAPSVRFYLVRHAAAEREPAHDDAARPLTPDGRAGFRAHAHALAGSIRVALIATSPALRARETAALLAEVTGAPVVEEPALASGRSSGAEVLAVARRLGEGAALVGHNPELAEAIASASEEPVEVRPGTVAALELDGGRVRLVWARRAP